MKLYNVADLKNSAIFFNKKTPKFIGFGILLICVICVIFIFLLSKTTKNYIIEGDGTVTTVNSIYIISHASGNVQEVNKKEGETVKKGEVILTLTDGLQHEDISNSLLLKDQLNNELKAVEIFNSSLESKENLMDANVVSQKEYFTKMEYYLSVLKDDYTSEQNQKKLIDHRKEKLSELEKTLSNVEDDIEKSNIKSQIESANEEIDSLESNLSLSIGQSDQIYFQLKIDNDTKRENIKKQIMDIDAKIDNLNDLKNLLEVKATSDGYVHYLTEMKAGVPILQNQTISTIYPDKDNMIVEGFVSAKDITKIAYSDECRIEITGVNHNQFERLKGKIISIDSGAITKEEHGTYADFYRILISINKSKIEDSRHNEIAIKPTFPVKIKVIYSKETYLEWILNMLNFNN